MSITFAIVNLNITDFVVFIVNWQQLRINKAFIRCQIQTFISIQDLCMQIGIYLNSLTLNQNACRLVISLALNALNFCQQLGYKCS